MARYVSRPSKQEKERRRLAAADDLIAGGALDKYPPRGLQSKIARTYGVSRATVSERVQRLRQEGKAGLKTLPYGGSEARLTKAQRERLRTKLLEGATRHGYTTDVWTGKRVSDLIRKEFGVHYSHRYVPQLLREQLGFSWNKPDPRPREKDPERSADGSGAAGRP